MSTQAEPSRVPVQEAVTHGVSGTPLRECLREGVHAEVRTESRSTRGRYCDVTGTNRLPIERAVIRARPS